MFTLVNVQPNPQFQNQCSENRMLQPTDMKDWTEICEEHQGRAREYGFLDDRQLVSNPAKEGHNKWRDFCELKWGPSPLQCIGDLQDGLTSGKTSARSCYIVLDHVIWWHFSQGRFYPLGTSRLSFVHAHGNSFGLLVFLYFTCPNNRINGHKKYCIVFNWSWMNYQPAINRGEPRGAGHP